MTDHLAYTLTLIAFAALLAWINLKTQSSSHWTALTARFVSFWLLMADVALIAWTLWSLR